LINNKLIEEYFYAFEDKKGHLLFDEFINSIDKILYKEELESISSISITTEMIELILQDLFNSNTSLQISLYDKYIVRNGIAVYLSVIIYSTIERIKNTSDTLLIYEDILLLKDLLIEIKKYELNSIDTSTIDDEFGIKDNIIKDIGIKQLSKYPEIVTYIEENYPEHYNYFV